MKVVKFIIGLFLLPIYPILKKRMSVNREKYQIGEKWVVVLESKGKKTTIQN